MHIEFEVKYYPVDLEQIQRRLELLGAICIKPRTLFKRVMFSTANHEVDCSKRWARVRHEGDKVTITVKKVLHDGIDGTLESEIETNDFDKACDLLAALGFVQRSYQESYRQIWQLHSCHVSVDCWPGLLPFIEIEGPDSASVELVSSMLGFDRSQALYGFVSTVYRKQYGIPAEEFAAIERLTFENVHDLFGNQP